MRADSAEEIDVKELFRRLWEGRWLLVSGVFLIGGASAGVSLIPDRRYEATVLVAPANEQGGRLGGLDAVVSQFSGLASLAGLARGSGGKAAESLAVLESRALTEEFIQERNLISVLVPRKASVFSLAGSGTEQVSTLWDAGEVFSKEVRHVSTDSKSGLVTLSIRWRDPVVAAEWANALVDATNARLRKQALEDASRNIAFLNAEAARTSIVEGRRAIFSLLEGELNKAMIAKGSGDYALKVLDPARPPEDPVYPPRVIWALLGAAVGFVLSAGLVLSRRR